MTNTTKTVHRHEVPIDGQFHEIVYSGYPIHVGMKNPRQSHIDIWIETDTEDHRKSEFRVFGTGHEIPKDCFHVGTVVNELTQLVWHLYERV